MTVYVDDMRLKVQLPGMRPARWSHLLADTPEELHEFAQRLGLRREWAQDEDNPITFHYDVTDTKRREAIALGAKAITIRETGKIINKRRKAQR